MNSADPRSLPDDGIPVLTDVVGSDELPLPEAPADADLDAAGPPSLAMFPELEPQPAQDRVATQEEPVEPALPAPLPQPWQETPAAQTSFAPAAGANDQGFHAAASTGDAPRLPEVPAPADEEPLAAAALAPPREAAHEPPATSAAAAPPAPPPETRDEMQTRIFEALAARLDRLLDQRLEPVVHGVVDAAFAGVKAGLAATVNQALREAVEQAVRDEFENKPD